MVALGVRLLSTVRLDSALLKPGFHIAVRCRKVAGGSLLPSSICRGPRTAVERFKWKRLKYCAATIVAGVP